MFLFALLCVVGFVGWHFFVSVFSFIVLRSLGFNYTLFMLSPSRFCLAIIFGLVAIYSHQKPRMLQTSLEQTTFTRMHLSPEISVFCVACDVACFLC